MLSKDDLRIADKNIYATNNPEGPKESHKLVTNFIIEHFKQAEQLSCLDAGCADGSFLFCLSKKITNKKVTFSGLDIHTKLLQRAESKIKNLKTYCKSLDDDISDIGTYDVITCLGVFSIFDDFEKIFIKLFSQLKNGGFLIILTEFNNNPVDVIMRYRDSRDANTNFEKGWNCFSKISVERIMKKYGCQFEWHDFNMPFQRKKEFDDPMRAWTIHTEENPFQQINGANQLINQSILKIYKK